MERQCNTSCYDFKSFRGLSIVPGEKKVCRCLVHWADVITNLDFGLVYIVLGHSVVGTDGSFYEVLGSVYVLFSSILHGLKYCCKAHACCKAMDYLCTLFVTARLWSELLLLNAFYTYHL